MKLKSVNEGSLFYQSKAPYQTEKKIQWGGEFNASKKHRNGYFEDSLLSQSLDWINNKRKIHDSKQYD